MGLLVEASPHFCDVCGVSDRSWFIEKVARTYTYQRMIYDEHSLMFIYN